MIDYAYKKSMSRGVNSVLFVSTFFGAREGLKHGCIAGMPIRLFRLFPSDMKITTIACKMWVKKVKYVLFMCIFICESNAVINKTSESFLQENAKKRQEMIAKEKNRKTATSPIRRWIRTTWWKREKKITHFVYSRGALVKGRTFTIFNFARRFSGGYFMISWKISIILTIVF